MLSGKCPFNDMLSIVRSVNTKIIYRNIPVSETESITENFNYQAFGYKSVDDFKLSTTIGKAPEFINITITPLSYYNLHDNFTLALAPDKRSKIIQGLLCDEFERIKNRALYFLETTNDEKEIKVYAVKNRMFIKTCFHSHKPVFHDLFSLYPDYLHHADAFIHYNINFFLIRLRLFYEKLFEDFLPKSKKTEKQLLAELFQMNPSVLYKQSALLTTTSENSCDYLVSDSGHNCNTENSEPLQHGFDSASSLPMAFEIIGKAYNIPAGNIKQFIELIGKIKWNGQVNTLGDILYQLMFELKDKGKPKLEASAETIAGLVSLLCIDKEDHPLSKASIKTCLQPGKMDKRPKPGSAKKIDIGTIFPDAN